MQNRYNQLFNFFLFSGLACFSYLVLILYSDLSEQHQKALISFWAFLSVMCFSNGIGFGIILINRWQKSEFQFIIKSKHRLVINCILMALILLLLNYLLLSIIKILLGIPIPFIINWPGIRLLILIWLVEIVIVSLIMINNFYRQLVLLHDKATKLEESSIKAQYIALQNQLNPHFLFNSLNTLISEIEYNPQNAVVFTQRLSDVYRYILQSQQQGLVPLHAELTFLDSYIFLHQVRLGNCIYINKQLEPSLMEMKIPSLSLQLLTENVIKHNIINADNPMKVEIYYSEKDQMIVVSNEIKLKRNVTYSGTGLKNLSARYKLVCNKDISIKNTNRRFTVKIPLLNE